MRGKGEEPWVLARCINGSYSDGCLLLGEFYAIRYVGSRCGVPYVEVCSIRPEALVVGEGFWLDEERHAWLPAAGTMGPTLRGQFPNSRFHVLATKEELAAAGAELLQRQRFLTESVGPPQKGLA